MREAFREHPKITQRFRCGIQKIGASRTLKRVIRSGRSGRRFRKAGRCCSNRWTWITKHSRQTNGLRQRGGAFGRRIVVGTMVFSYALGLPAKNCFNSRSNGRDRLRFIAPVIIGDTICRLVETVDIGQGP